MFLNHTHISKLSRISPKPRAKKKHSNSIAARRTLVTATTAPFSAVILPPFLSFQTTPCIHHTRRPDATMSFAKLFSTTTRPRFPHSHETDANWEKFEEAVAEDEHDWMGVTTPSQASAPSTTSTPAPTTRTRRTTLEGENNPYPPCDDVIPKYMTTKECLDFQEKISIVEILKRRRREGSLDPNITEEEFRALVLQRERTGKSLRETAEEEPEKAEACLLEALELNLPWSVVAIYTELKFRVYIPGRRLSPKIERRVFLTLLKIFAHNHVVRRMFGSNVVTILNKSLSEAEPMTDKQHEVRDRTRYVCQLLSLGQPSDWMPVLEQMRSDGSEITLPIYQNLARTLSKGIDPIKTLDVLETMKTKGLLPNTSVYTSIISMHCHLGDFSGGERLLASMLATTKVFQDAVTRSSTTPERDAEDRAVVENYRASMETFHETAFEWNAAASKFVKKHLHHDDPLPPAFASTFIPLFHAYGENRQQFNAKVEPVRKLHALLVKSKTAITAACFSTMINVYARCGQLGEALKVWDECRLQYPQHDLQFSIYNTLFIWALRVPKLSACDLAEKLLEVREREEYVSPRRDELLRVRRKREILKERQYRREHKITDTPPSYARSPPGHIWGSKGVR